MSTPEPMDAEFDTVAEWTAEVALAFGPDHRVAAGCRGSGSPSSLDWLADRLELTAGARLLDCGAGVGGPAAHLAERTGVRPVLFDPAAGANRAARTLFGLPAFVASADAIPVADASFDAAWCLGVLCTTEPQAQPTVLAEMRRVVRPGSRLGLLVFLAARHPLPEQPEGNHFPSEDGLADLLTRAGWTVTERIAAADLPPTPAQWRQREAEIEAELERRYGARPAWQIAQEQSAKIARLIGDGDVVAHLLIVRAS